MARDLIDLARAPRPASASGLGELLGGVALGGVTAILVVKLPLVLAIVLVLAMGGLAALAMLTRFDVKATATAFLVLTAFFIPLNKLYAGPLSFSDVCMIAAAALFALIRLREGRRAEGQAYRQVVIGLAIIAVGGFIGMLFEAPGAFFYKALGVDARDISGWGQNVANLGKFVFGSLLPMAMWWLARPSRALMRRLLGAFVYGATFSGLVGILLPFGKGGARSFGLTVHPGQFGSLSLIAMGAALALLLSRPPFRAWGYAVLPILALSILLSGSRAALGAMVVLGLMIGPLTKSRMIMGAVLAGTACVLLLFVLGGIRPGGTNAIGRTLGSDPHAANSSEIRSDLGHRVLAKWSARPITGNGFNYMKPSHNVYLGLLASAGVLGVVGLIVVVSAIVRRAWRRRSDLMVASVAAGYVAYLTAAYFDNIFWERWLWWTVGMVVAVTATQPVPGEVGYRAPDADDELVADSTR